MYEVPLWDYLRMVGRVRAPEHLLQNQRVDSGRVLFTSPREISRLRDLIEYANTGNLPIHELNGAELQINDLRQRATQVAGTRSGPTIYDHRESLENPKFGTTDSEGDWWTARCPSCALHDKDRTGNNLHFHSTGPFACWSDCESGEIWKAFKEIAPVTDVKTEIPTEYPARADVTRDMDTKLTPDEGLAKVALVTETERRETSLTVEEVAGGYQVIEARKDKETCEVTFSRSTVPASNVENIWGFICDECKVGEKATYYDIREYLMLITGFSGSEDAWAGGKNRTKYFFPYHYYPLKVLEIEGAISYGSRGDITRLKEIRDVDKPPWVKVAEEVLEGQK